MYRIWYEELLMYLPIFDYKWHYSISGEYFLYSGTYLYEVRVDGLKRCVIGDQIKSDYIVERATGFKTKNDVNIYEGDVIALKKHLYDSEPEIGFIYKNRFGDLRVRTPDDRLRMVDVFDYGPEGVNKLGTIHNPEFKHLVMNDE